MALVEGAVVSHQDNRAISSYPLCRSRLITLTLRIRMVDSNNSRCGLGKERRHPAVPGRGRGVFSMKGTWAGTCDR